jgi:hypothetical protein
VSTHRRNTRLDHLAVAASLCNGGGAAGESGWHASCSRSVQGVTRDRFAGRWKAFVTLLVAFVRGAALCLAAGCGGSSISEGARLVPRPALSKEEHRLLTAPNATGEAATFSTAGAVRTDGLFFRSVGTNGRSCATCHVAGDGWTVNPPSVRERFRSTGGTDPIFRTNDGSNSPEADVSTVDARRAAYSMLLTKGLIRVGIGIPAGADFELIDVDDPYHHASAAELSLFRGRFPRPTSPSCPG